MLSLKTALLILIVVLSTGDLTSPPCFGGSDAEEIAKTGDAAAIREDSRPVLVIPAGDCGTAALLLARVSRHIRQAERSALFSTAAEDEYDDGLQQQNPSKDQVHQHGGCREPLDSERRQQRAARCSQSADMLCITAPSRDIRPCLRARGVLAKSRCPRRRRGTRRCRR